MSIDILIVLSFLVLNLVIGLYYGRNITNFKDYALGGRNFSTGTLITTLVATWVGGSSLAIKVSESYTRGLYYITTGVFELCSFLIVAYLLAPRMKEFLGSVSIAEAMGKMYGKNVRIFTAFCGVLGTIGFISVQFKVSAGLFSYFVGINGIYATLASAVVVVFYASYSGIRAVTFTDMVQLFAFSVFIPGLALLVWGTLDAPSAIVETLNTNPNFDYARIFSSDNEKFYSWIALLCFFLIPSLDPAAFQRISMAKNVHQVRILFSRAAFIYIIIAISMYWIAILLLSTGKTLNPSELISYTISQYSYPGLIGFTLIGIMAMVMSTADSYINSSSILITHDILIPLEIKSVKNNEILTARIAAILIGTAAILPALFFKGLLDLIIFTFSFYMPVVTPPFILSVLGFRSSPRAVFAAMSAGFITVVIFNVAYTTINSIIPGVFMNVLVLMLYHYLLKQPGGWVGIKDDGDLKYIRQQKKLAYKKFFMQIRNFSVINFCKANTPKNDSSYTWVGIFCIVAVFSAMYSMPVEVREKYSNLVEFIYHSVLIIATIFLVYPIFPESFKSKTFISIFWVLGLFYVLPFIACLQLIISNFGQFQLMTFLLSVVVLSMLMRWQLALILIVTGVFTAIQIFKYYTEVEIIRGDFGTLQFKIMYVLLLVSSVIIAFFKPKQDHLDATEAKVEDLKMEITDLDHEVDDLYEQVNDYHNQVTHYSEKISDQEKEIERLGATAQKILNNVNHELRLPVGNVMNFSEMLYKGLGKHSPEMLKELSDEVYKNTNRLSTMILNMLDLANLEVKKVNLNKTLINFSEIVTIRVKTCRNIYLQGKPINFKLMIDPEIMISVDPNYIRQAIDNLVINAINFSEEGTIIVKLEKQKNFVQFTITDQGIGIPKDDIFDIFTPFKMGSNTESKAEGRGIGLALCKSIVEAHDGKISASSKGTGAIFSFVLPL